MPAIPECKNILVGLSGGVDSAACACLLTDAGHTVRCAYFVLSDVHLPGQAAAADVAAALGLPLDIIDLRDTFYARIIRPFCADYCAGITPNPCVLCNPTVKFAALCDAADRCGCDAIATGHYARIEQRGSVAVLRKAANSQRDQSYMLYRLEQPQLKRLMLPLGGLDKEQIRRLAHARGLAAADAPDSQEICFVPDDDYAGFIHAAGHRGKQGRFIAPDGADLGAHKGVEYYTIGQRRGLGLSYGQPLFVREILPNGDIRLGLSGQEFAAGVDIFNCNVNPLYSLDPGAVYQVKLRSATRPANCTVTGVTSDGVTLTFDEPQRAPAPGQSAVLYDGEYVAGGGIITRCRPIE